MENWQSWLRLGFISKPKRDLPLRLETRPALKTIKRRSSHNGAGRGFFGESSREFFERPPATDGVKMVPKAYYPPPAPAAYTPAHVVVVYVRPEPKQGRELFPDSPPVP